MTDCLSYMTLQAAIREEVIKRVAPEEGGRALLLAFADELRQQAERSGAGGGR